MESIIVVSLLLSPLIVLIIVLLIEIIKDKVFPPCPDCAYYEYHKGYFYEEHNCHKIRHKITGNPERCSYARQTIKCWFKKKQERL